VSKDGKLGNAAVLGLDGAEAVEALLIGVGKEAERIPEAEGGLFFWSTKVNKWEGKGEFSFEGKAWENAE